MSMTWRLKLDEEPVNGATFAVSMAFRLVFLVLAIAVFSAAQPWLSFWQLAGIAVAYMLLVWAKTAKIIFSD